MSAPDRQAGRAGGNGCSGSGGSGGCGGGGGGGGGCWGSGERGSVCQLGKLRRILQNGILILQNVAISSANQSLCKVRHGAVSEFAD